MDIMKVEEGMWVHREGSEQALEVLKVYGHGMGGLIYVREVKPDGKKGEAFNVFANEVWPFEEG